MSKKIIKTIKEKVLKKKEPKPKDMTAEEMDSLPTDIQKERGALYGQISALEEENEELQQQIKLPKEKEEVAKFLQQKEEELSYRESQGNFSLRGLFDVLTRRNIGRKVKDVNLYSYDEEGAFGKLYDITFNRDGRIGVWTKENGYPLQICAGATLKNIFWDYKGLVNSANHSQIRLSLNKTGEYVNNVFAEEVSSVIMDANGKYHISRVDKRELIAWLVDKEREINSLYKYLEMAERALSKAGHDINLSNLMAKLNTERRKTAETILTKYAKEGNEMVRNWKQVDGELVEKAHQLSIKNKEVENLENVKENIMKKLESIESGSSVDKAKQEILNYINLLVGLVKGQKITFAGYAEEEKEPLRKHFENILAKGGEKT